MAATEADRARLFFALWPPPPVQARLAALAHDLRPECGGRAMAQEKIHLTLFFVGPTERARIAGLERAAALAHAKPFSLGIDRIGYFRRSGVVWAGATQCPSELAELAASLRAALAQEGFAGEERPYVPHMTLLRDAVRKPSKSHVEPCPWHAHDFVLVESLPVQGAVRYEPRARWPLRQSAD
ncbi:MAG TPA: RNA 2',3'-cyclic phosphodiesterase [Burkholderiales bacterium]|nr:RNA 2',3'-cyclic phosphodiesterase [Burkholderiales bacterium]